MSTHPDPFIDRAPVLALFASSWHARSLEHLVTHRYDDPKALWEVALERVD